MVSFLVFSVSTFFCLWIRVLISWSTFCFAEMFFGWCARQWGPLPTPCNFISSLLMKICLFSLLIEPFVVKKKLQGKTSRLNGVFYALFFSPLCDSFIFFGTCRCKIRIIHLQSHSEKAQVVSSRSPLYPLSSLPSLSLPSPPRLWPPPPNTVLFDWVLIFITGH